VVLSDPSYLPIIRKNLDWEKVEERLNRYKNISELFPLKKMKAESEPPPYYCHFMAWRLGVWKNEDRFQFLETILEIAKKIPGWKNTRIPSGREFDNYWGFIWELQVAAFFSEHLKLKTEWLASGPDLLISTKSGQFYVECTTYRKSFYLENFISELFSCLSEYIEVTHAPFMKFSLLKNNPNDVKNFLHTLFNPYLDPSFLTNRLGELQKITPILLPVDSALEIENFHVYLDNPEIPTKDDDLLQNMSITGDPLCYLHTVLKETIGENSAKSGSNNLNKCHPNLVMVNFLLGIDYQLTKMLRELPEPEIAKTLDGVIFAVCGIDRMLTFDSSDIYIKMENHPIKPIIEQYL